MKVKIVADSSANLLQLEGIDYTIVPLHIIVGEQEFIDDENVDVTKMQDAIDAYGEKTSTSCPSAEGWMNAFGEADVVYCVTITSNLSGAFNSGNIAKQIYEQENPGKKVYMIDSLSTGPEMVLLIEKLREMIQAELETNGEDGFDSEKIYDLILEYTKRTHLYFSLASLNNLAKNGRISSIVAKGVGLLGIRIVGKASDEGTLQPLDKSRGDKKAFVCLMRHLEEHGYNGGRIFISYSGTPQAAEQFKNLVIEKYGQFNGSIMRNGALCSYYAEPESILVGFEA